MEHKNVSTWLWFVVSVVFIATIIFLTMQSAGAQVGPAPTATPTVMIPPGPLATLTPFVPTETPVPPPHGCADRDANADLSYFTAEPICLLADSGETVVTLRH